MEQPQMRFVFFQLFSTSSTYEDKLFKVVSEETNHT